MSYYETQIKVDILQFWHLTPLFKVQGKYNQMHQAKHSQIHIWPVDYAEEYVFWLKAIYLFPKKPSLIHWLKIPCLVAKLTKVILLFWLLKEKGTFLLKLLFVLVLATELYGLDCWNKWRLSFHVIYILWGSNFVKKIAISVHVHSYETQNRILAFAEFFQESDRIQRNSFKETLFV